MLSGIIICLKNFHFWTSGKEAFQINCYENLAEFNDAKLEKVCQGALAKLTDAEKAALGLTKLKVAGPTSTSPAAGSLLPTIKQI